jgi:hypothetical protein
MRNRGCSAVGRVHFSVVNFGHVVGVRIWRKSLAFIMYPAVGFDELEQAVIPGYCCKFSLSMGILHTPESRYGIN